MSIKKSLQIQTIIYKTLHIKRKIENIEPLKNRDELMCLKTEGSLMKTAKNSINNEPARDMK
jgi:hypothetical protein